MWSLSEQPEVLTKGDKDGSLVCQLCWQGSEVESVAGQLHAEKLESGKVISAHLRCMQYSSGLTQYKCQVFGGFDIGEVEEEISRGYRLRCFICRKTKGKKSRGASSGCAVKTCRKTFHFTCASNHPEAVTKRLVVTKKKHNPDDKFVLYRVFCSREHEALFRKMLKVDLRGTGSTNRKTSRKKGDNQEEDCGSTAEAEATAAVIEDHEGSSAEAEESGDMDVADSSQNTNESLDTSELLTDSSLLMMSPALSSSPISHHTVGNKDGVVSTEGGDDSSTTTPTPKARSAVNGSLLSSPTVTSSSQQQPPCPGQTPTKSLAPKADLSQPLLCRLTEELSTIHHGSEADGSSRNAESGAGRDAVSPVRNGWHSGEADRLAASPGEESVENKSPNIPQAPAKTPVKVMKAVTDHVISAEKGLVLQAHSENTAKPAPAAGAKKAAPSPKKTPLNCKKPVQSPASHNGPAKPPRQVSKPSSGDKPSMKTSPFNGHSPSQGRTVSEESGSQRVNGQVRSPPPAQAEESQGKGRVSNGAQSQTVEVCESGIKGDSSVHAGAQSSQETVSDAGAGATRGSRKRNRSSVDGGGVKLAEDPAPKVIKDAERTGCDLQPIEGVVLIPSSMEQFQTQEAQVTRAVVEQVEVGGEGVWVWQRVTANLLDRLPSPLMLLFMLDLVKELEKENNEAVVDLLFNADCLATRLDAYLIAQEQVFQRVGDQQGQQSMEATLWASLDRTTHTLPMVHLVHTHARLATLVLDLRRFKLRHHVTANIQAYRGLFGWSPDTEVLPFPLTQSRQGLAVQREALALKTWLTRVNPISEVTVLPADDLLYDKTTSVANDEFFRLVDFLKAKTHTAMVVEGAEGESVQQVVPLLVFQPVELFMLNFRDYFQKACRKFFQGRGLMNGLALVPFSNLYSADWRSITGLLQAGDGETGGGASA
ncbi:hypothetical protein ACOMHN_036914 [Nucella lapillus]